VLQKWTTGIQGTTEYKGTAKGEIGLQGRIQKGATEADSTVAGIQGIQEFKVLMEKWGVNWFNKG
jgi:hypothetical protein